MCGVVFLQFYYVIIIPKEKMGYIVVLICKLFIISYYCVGNNTSPIPAETICPVGNYCPEGSYQPTPCPQGTLASSLGNSNASDCELCNPGRYCTPNSSMSGESFFCSFAKRRNMCLLCIYLISLARWLLKYIYLQWFMECQKQSR